MHAGILSAMALGNAYIYQGGLGNGQDLLQGLADGIDQPGPALFHLFCIDPQSHRMLSRSWKDFDYLSLASRAFPSFRYAPRSQQDFLKGTLEMGQNPQWKLDWVTGETEEGQGTTEYTITWADWAFTFAVWADQFTLVDPSSEQVPIQDYIALSIDKREGRIPVITRAGKEGISTFRVSSLVAEITDETLAHWRTLQELAGMRVSHPEKFRKEITVELTAAFEKEKEALIADYENRMRELETRQAALFRQQLKERLVALSRAARNRVDQA
jgi:hypothetical protein